MLYPGLYAITEMQHLAKNREKEGSSGNHFTWMIGPVLAYPYIDSAGLGLSDYRHEGCRASATLAGLIRTVRRKSLLHEQ